jgi:hypothetical protein
MAVPSTLRSGLVERTEELTTSAPLFKSSLTSEPSVERVTLLQQERMEEENVVDLMLPLSTSSTTGPRDESQNFSEKVHESFKFILNMTILILGLFKF